MKTVSRFLSNIRWNCAEMEKAQRGGAKRFVNCVQVCPVTAQDLGAEEPPGQCDFERLLGRLSEATPESTLGLVPRSKGTSSLKLRSGRPETTSSLKLLLLPTVVGIRALAPLGVLRSQCIPRVLGHWASSDTTGGRLLHSPGRSTTGLGWTPFWSVDPGVSASYPSAKQLLNPHTPIHQRCVPDYI